MAEIERHVARRRLCRLLKCSSTAIFIIDLRRAVGRRRNHRLRFFVGGMRKPKVNDPIAVIIIIILSRPSDVFHAAAAGHILSLLTTS